ncbi:cupredoxin family copper-binding protein [Bradyrhizobium sp. U87765 SZCCT0131]|uniref:cupredoxin domain-containing protein n=1 Tax=unclassified Bradyrhizobium TaxID=2631580 RepID=UPI001BA72A81|nr:MULTISPECIES: cupredoxin family copper-binding protein [unclassified Bradyrhizobium]MBR1222778.1 cupredoxin family copper-binding protein [Bradyrhizobium sp. U87765 SZCCT0131]MBR1265141.1 cupredoxin family copper-binding protein [Bradyrhizobium sp. U87765 SZCCT0134]MBR1303080.1 cupredoxin family copper-binding protein [Bradyrhizobium sp. U87765 SZCCT0110]MBR1318686.1 cupredoxin family copper-binding protein [Bradyrhizobium sp. U87765 SZCCT0109]MBR1347009.1 cupredoxin family copper-binding p
MALALSLVAVPRAHSAAPANVTIDNFTFGPQEIDVAVGTTVTWLNHDDIPHSVVAGGKAFRSKALDTDESFAFTFTTPGTFDYFCGLHPHMVGKVVVKP